MKEYVYLKKLKIGGHNYKVKILNQYTHDDTGKYIGKHNPSKEELLICSRDADSSNISLTFMNSIWWHEVLHAVCSVYGVSLEENEIDRLAEGLLQIGNQHKFYPIKQERGDKK